MSQLLLQIAIGFFGLQVAAWAAVCVYLRVTHQRRAREAAGAVLAGEPETSMAQAA